MDRYKFATSMLLLVVLTLSTMSNAVAAETRLLYPQEQALKKVSNNLSKIIGTFKSYNKMHSEKNYSRDTKDLLALPEKLKECKADFEKGKFPEDNQKVKNVKSWFAALEKNLPVLIEVYQKGREGHEKEAAKADVSNFPDYDADCKRLKTMYSAYKNPSSTFRNTKKAVEVVPKFNDEYAFFKNLPEKYAILIKANKARTLTTWLRTNEKYMDPFKKYMDDYADKLPGEIESAINQAASMAEKAKAEKKPLFFKGGVKQHLDNAGNRMQVLVAIKGEKDPAVQKAVAYYSKKQKIIDDAEEALAAELLAGVTTPPDVYKGSDKSRFLDMVKAEWKKLYPSDQILAIRFHMTDFQRKTSWKWNNSGWYKVDSSAMAVKVIVKKSDNIAVIYPCYINKDHLKGDKISIGAHTKKSGYVVEKMLMKNLKL